MPSLPYPSAIRLIPDLCRDAMKALESADWDASERGDCGTRKMWDSDGEEFQAAVESATAAIHEEAGIIDGRALALALDRMAATEKWWGDDPQTRQVRIRLAKILDWQCGNGAIDLPDMLRTGED